MVRPASFAYNLETAKSNAFQVPSSNLDGAARLAANEFDVLARLLDRVGVEVHVGADTADPTKPDACFPNNWVSFHEDGSLVLYPMLAPSRRLERRTDLLERLIRDGRYNVRRTVDLSHWEQHGSFLEGTGSLVLDREHRLAYACLSPRTMLDPLGDFAAQLGYELVLFEAVDGQGRPIYHTNVMMSVAHDFAIACLESLPSPTQRAALLARLEHSGHELLLLSLGQIKVFSSNMLALEI